MKSISERFSEMCVWMCMGGVVDAARAPSCESASGVQEIAKRGVMMGRSFVREGSRVRMWEIVAFVAARAAEVDSSQ